MATRRQPLIPGWLIPGVSAATLVVAVALAAFLALWWNAPQGDWVAVWQDSYLWHVVRPSGRRFSRRCSLSYPQYSSPAPSIAGAFLGDRCCCVCAQ